MTIEKDDLLWQLNFQHRGEDGKPMFRDLEVEPGKFLTCQVCTAALRVGAKNPDIREWETVATGTSYCKPMDKYVREEGRRRALHHLRLAVKRGDIARGEILARDGKGMLKELLKAYGSRRKKRAA